MKQFDSTNTEMVLFSYSIGAVYILIWELIVSQRLFEALEFCSHHPRETYGRILLYSTVGYFGLNVVLTLVKHFGALVAVTGEWNRANANRDKLELPGSTRSSF